MARRCRSGGRADGEPSTITISPKPSAMTPSSIQNKPCSLTHPIVTIEKFRILAASAREHVTALCFFLDQHPRSKRTRLLQRGKPDVAISFVQKVADRKPGA